MRYLILASIFFLPAFGRAHYSLMDTGDLVPSGFYRLAAEAQFVTSENDGTNVIGRFDMPFNEDSNLKALIGFGTTDFEIGGFYKWVPIPDYDNQPAVGLIAGAQYARFEDVDDWSLRLTPFASKAFETSFGQMEPYAGLPFGIRNLDGDVDTPLQLAVGTKVLLPDRLKYISFIGELGLDLNDAFNYLSLGVLINVDEQRGIQFE